MSISIEELVLLPIPQKMDSGDGEFLFGCDGVIVCEGEGQTLLPVADIIRDAVCDTQHVHMDIRAGKAGQYKKCRIRISLDESKGIAAEGYVLDVSTTCISITASAPAGAFYAAVTLKQILRQVCGSIPAMHIEDWPDFPNRGVMLDISRDKVPTLESLFSLVDMLAGMKINHFELYMEHTYAYVNHRDVWAQADPITGEDILRLDAYCRERFVELVPNQNSFGHMTRWLKLPQYNDYAMCPEGFEDPWSPGRHVAEPWSLDPASPKALDLIDEWYGELLPHFTSSKLNVGCDETFDLGQGRSKEACETLGKGKVYLEFLLKIRDLAQKHGKTMHFWADVVNHYPELIPDIPKDIIALEWGYEADYPKEENCARLAESGLQFYTCPATNTVASMTGRYDACVENQHNAARLGLQYGAIGVLNTEWGDMGNFQYPASDFFGYAQNAALTWSYKSNERKDILPALNKHVFFDEAGVMGSIIWDFGVDYKPLAGIAQWDLVFMSLLNTPAGDPVLTKADEKTLKMVEENILSTETHLKDARMNRPDGALIIDEYRNSARMQIHAVRRALANVTGTINTSEAKNSLAEEIRLILGEHRRLWTARNRVGGLQDSTPVFENLLKEYTT